MQGTGVKGQGTGVRGFVPYRRKYYILSRLNAVVLTYTVPRKKGQFFGLLADPKNFYQINYRISTAAQKTNRKKKRPRKVSQRRPKQKPNEITVNPTEIQTRDQKDRPNYRNEKNDKKIPTEKLIATPTETPTSTLQPPNSKDRITDRDIYRTKKKNYRPIYQPKIRNTDRKTNRNTD